MQGLLFNIYTPSAWVNLLSFLLLLIGIGFINEVSRRTKIWGIIFFIALPVAITIYFIVINACAAYGIEWARQNYTCVYKSDWSDYLKPYIGVAVCLGFMAIRLGVGIGKNKNFKIFPYACLAGYTIICSCRALMAGIEGYTPDGTIYFVGWWNILTAAAGFITIGCLAGIFGIYVSKRKQDVLCPNLNWLFIAAHSVWSFAYIYINDSAEAWFYLAVIIAPAFANAIFNRGGWLQNRAQTLTLWLMLSQTVPVFSFVGADEAVYFTGATYGVLSGFALALALLCLAVTVRKGVAQNKNPYLHEVFADTAYYKSVLSRAETDGKIPE